MKKNNKSNLQYKLKQIQPYPNTFKVEFAEKRVKSGKLNEGINIVSSSDKYREVILLKKVGNTNMSITYHETKIGNNWIKSSSFSKNKTK